jgi:hypothetical protein
MRQPDSVINDGGFGRRPFKWWNLKAPFPEENERQVIAAFETLAPEHSTSVVGRVRLFSEAL